MADCAVFGVRRRAAGPAGGGGGRGRRRACAPPTLAELRSHVAQSLDATAAPREMHVVDELPRRGIGKVDRRALAARFGA